MDTADTKALNWAMSKAQGQGLILRPEAIAGLGLALLVGLAVRSGKRERTFQSARTGRRVS
jgi:hypothetical protein